MPCLPPFPTPTDEQRINILKTYGVTERLIREKERCQITSINRTTWWEMEQRNEVPIKRHLGKSIAWRLSDLLLWVNSVS